MRLIQRRVKRPANTVRRKNKFFNFPIASGPLTMVMDGLDSTKGLVLAYNDNVINIPQMLISDAAPVRRACINIIKIVGTNTNNVWVARPYKLNIKVNNTLVAIIRSLYFGTRKTLDENNADWVILDFPQYQDTLS